MKNFLRKLHIGKGSGDRASSPPPPPSRKGSTGGGPAVHHPQAEQRAYQVSSWLDYVPTRPPPPTPPTPLEAEGSASASSVGVGTEERRQSGERRQSQEKERGRRRAQEEDMETERRRSQEEDELEERVIRESSEAEKRKRDREKEEDELEEFQLQLALEMSGRDNPEEMEIEVAEQMSLGFCPPSSSAAEVLAARYWNFNALGYDCKISDGFYDPYVIGNGPASINMPSLIDLRAQSLSHNSVNWEAVLVHKGEDPELMKLEQKAFIMVFELRSRTSEFVGYVLVQKLASLVANQMGGAIFNPENMSVKYQNMIRSLRTRFGSVVVPLGQLKIGLARHRALLFKVLADSLDVPCRLLKGRQYTGSDDGALNIVRFDEGREFIVDLVTEPGTLISSDTLFTKFEHCFFSDDHQLSKADTTNQLGSSLSGVSNSACDSFEYELLDRSSTSSNIAPSDTDGPATSQACITRIGPWGGNGAQDSDITVEPVCLNTIIVRSGETIQSISFSYSDKYGKHHCAGPWGSQGTYCPVASFHAIHLGLSEYLIKVSGTIGMSTEYSCDVITSLQFITNVRSYGPFGDGAGAPFHSPLMSSGSIVGFFARAAGLVDSIGFYVNSGRQPVEKRSLIRKVGLWGRGSAGTPYDVDELPHRLISIVVHSDKAINSLTFTYSDSDGQHHTVGPWGVSYSSPDASFHEIMLGRSEFIKEVSGTFGPCFGCPNILTSLLFVTNTGSYGPFGQGGGNTFCSPVQENESIVGFFAHSDKYIYAIGFYMDTIKEQKSLDSSSHGSMTDTILDDMFDESTMPANVPLSFLQEITENFSDKRKIGIGGSGVVYEGVVQHRSIAIKKLLNSRTIEDGPFYSEATFLMNVKHQNIVRFLGFCAHTEQMPFKMERSGRLDNYVYPEMRERLLCFEYISKGSLDNYLTDELKGLEWHTRYQIIQGICHGIQYLHKEKGIVHMDLKPANVLLDDHMVPKITDFGISRHLDGISRAVTKQCLISLGYCAPEYLRRGEISFKSDIYSLGVIITDLVTGRKRDPDIKNVLRRWRYRWNKSAKSPPSGYKQVTRCIEIALNCMSESPKGRPYIWEIISMLNATESADENISSVNAPAAGPISPYPWELLDFDRLELHFPFEVNKQISCPLELTNGNDNYIAFDIQIRSTVEYLIEPNKGIVPPQSECNVIVTLQPRESRPDSVLCNDNFDVRCTIVDEGLMAKDITEDMFDAKKGKVVDEVNLTVAF